MKTPVAFTHAFQPIVDADQKEIVSYEVLLRGKHNESCSALLQQVDPDQRKAFDQHSRNRAIALASELGLSCSLNLNFTPDSILFEDGKYVDETIRTARDYGITSEQIVLEILESEIIRNIDALLQALNNLRRKGATIAVDDFGSGYAGLNLLADVQPDLIKLDMNLIRNIHENGARQSIVKAISLVCLDLGIDLLAEGVENKEEFTFLKDTGISLFQGFFFAKPGLECFPPLRKDCFEM